MQNRVIKHSLLILVVGFLFANIARDYVKFYPELRPLDGYFEPVLKDTFDLEKWFDGSFSEKTNAYLNENFAFRCMYVRLYNQIRFSFFKKANVKDMLIGKEDYLFQMGQLMEYDGRLCVGEQAVRDTVAKLKRLEDLLRGLEKRLLVIMAPNKIRIYPEYLDDRLNKGHTANCNYELYRKIFTEAGINFIDVNSWFIQQKDRSRYQPIPKLGMHWSRLEAVIVADSILERLGAISGHLMPQINITSIAEKDTMEAPDDDGVKSMNLLWYPSYKKMGYPEFEMVNTEKAVHSALVISDSFWWDIYMKNIPLSAFKDNEFWYYCHDAYGTRLEGKADVSSLDIKRRILQNDYIILVCAESNLSVFGFGFISRALRAMEKPIYPSPQEMEDYRVQIEGNKEWYDQIARSAFERKITLDSAIRMNINYMFQLHGPAHRLPTVDDIVIKIRNSPDWLAQIKKDAEKSGSNLDTAIRRNAEFVIWEKKNKAKK